MVLRFAYAPPSLIVRRRPGVAIRQIGAESALGSDIVCIYGGSGGSVGTLVKGVDGDGKMSLDEGNSRRSCDQEGDGLNITNILTELI